MTEMALLISQDYLEIGPVSMEREINYYKGIVKKTSPFIFSLEIYFRLATWRFAD